MEDLNIADYIEKMPKVELHLHLEGAIPLEALWQLIEKYDCSEEVKNLDALKSKFAYKDFPHFIETWIWKNKFIREYEDFTFIAREVARDLGKQNIKYAEVFYSPSDHKSKNLNSQKITEAIVMGLEQAKEETEIYLIADLVRDFGSENGMKVMNELNEMKNSKVIGIGIGGSEQNFPPELFKEVYAIARNMGFRTSVHAGEAAGSQSIWGALNVLQAERIGHGTRAYEDEALIKYMIENQTPVELCPISNVRTGVVKSIEEHPMKDYYQKGMKIFLNTDDPKMFNNTLTEEYTLFISKFDFGLNDVKVLMLNAIDSAWCNPEKKESLKTELTNYYRLNNIN
jgi:adenosine deaminase